MSDPTQGQGSAQQRLSALYVQQGQLLAQRRACEKQTAVAEHNLAAAQNQLAGLRIDAVGLDEQMKVIEAALDGVALANQITAEAQAAEKA